MEKSPASLLEMKFQDFGAIQSGALTGCSAQKRKAAALGSGPAVYVGFV
jgi:hypothetical protein